MLAPVLALTATHARHLLHQLCTHGAAWIADLRGTGTEPAPRAKPLDRARLRRVLRAIRWTAMLAALFAGRLQLPPPSARARKPRNEDYENLNDPEPGDRDPSLAGSDRAMVRAFRTRPVGKIIARICRDLGISQAHDLWPAELVALTQTPVDWAAANPLPPTPCDEPDPPPAGSPHPQTTTGHQPQPASPPATLPPHPHDRPP